MSPTSEYSDHDFAEDEPLPYADEPHTLYHLVEPTLLGTLGTWYFRILANRANDFVVPRGIEVIGFDCISQGEDSICKS